jgi:Secretion system C-terminal sorting domain
MKNIFLILILTQWAWASIAQNCPPTATLTTPSTGSSFLQAAQTLTASATLTVANTDTVTYRAGESVTFNAGFETFVSGNARFQAEIGSCAAPLVPTYEMDTLKIRCGQASCMPVKLTAPIVNGTGWTLEIDYDTTKVRFTTHALGRIIATTGGSASAFVNNGKLILSIYLTTATNVQGNIGDTLICLGWEHANPNIPSNTLTTLSGTIETNTLLGTTVAPVASQLRLETNHYLNLWVFYQGLRPMTHNNAINQTMIRSGNALHTMTQVGILPNSGLYLLNTATDTLVQVQRRSLPGIGIPVIQGADGALVFQVIARDRSYRPTASALMSMDVDGDSRITAADITHIQRRAVGIYATGFPQLGANDTISSRHFPKSWLNTRREYRLSTTYPNWDGIGCARDFVPKIDTFFKIDGSYRNRCDTAILDIVMLMLGDADGNYNGDSLRHQRLAPQSTATMHYQVCNELKPDIRNNVLYIKVYADKKMAGGDWIIQNSPLTLLGAEVADANATLLTSNLVGNNLFITASAKSAEIPAGAPVFYLKVPAHEIDKIQQLKDLGELTGYWNTSIANHSVQPKCGDPRAIRLYPNPTSNGLISIEHLDKMPETIQVYNALGQLVIAHVEPQQHITPLDLTPFAEGVYFVKVDNQTFKVVKK